VMLAWDRATTGTSHPSDRRSRRTCTPLPAADQPNDHGLRIIERGC
jgi:hypothetical protein